MKAEAARDGLRTREIYGILRAEILGNQFETGTPISQVQLAERLGVSRTPLREALRLLERDGLIQSEPNRRVWVRPLSVTDLEQLYATRIVLEALAVRLSVPQFVQADLVAIDAAIAAMEEAAAELDVESWEQPHRTYHELIRRHAGERIVAIAADLSDHADRYRRLYLTAPLAWISAAAEHLAIASACREADAERAAELLARHLARTALAVAAMIAPDHDPAAIRAAVSLVAATRPSGT